MEHLTLLIGAGADAGSVEYTALRGDESGQAAVLWRGGHRYDPAQAVAEGQALLRATRRAQGRGVAEGLVEPGRLLFDLLLPAPLKEILRGEPGSLLLAPGPLAEVPWPLLHDGLDHLGLRWALGEVGEGPVGLRRPVPRSRDGRLLVVADPAADLPAARFEGEAMAALAEAVPCDLRLGRLRRADFLRIFKNFRFIHFAGHADAADASGPGGWRLADGRVGARDLAALAGDAAPHLVFANACRSAEVPELVPALLEAGVRAVVGTLVDLPDLPGADFTLHFYRELEQGGPVGEALRHARRAVAPHPVWAAYRLFGDPRMVCFERRVVAQWPAGVRSAVVLAARAPVETTQAEDVAEELQQFRDVTRACVEAQGGRLLPGRAAVVRAVFGLPVGHENDAERAVRAAHMLVDRVPEVRVALEAGSVTAVGLDVVGVAPLVAEAACWARGPGLWLLPGAAHRVARFARVGPDGVWLGWRSPDEDPPLVGRQAELDRLVAAAARGEVVTVLGPAGQGKSRLVRALVERLPGRVILCRAAGEVEAEPFAALVPLLRTLLGEGPVEAALARMNPNDSEDFLSIDALLAGERPSLRDRAPVLAAVLGEAPGAPLDAAVVPAAVREVVEASGGSPCLIFEDLHALTDATLAVVDELMGAAGAAVIGTARPSLLERRPRWSGERLVLGPLGEDESLAVLGQVLPPETSPEDRRLLLTRAEGNPLFLRELGLARAEGRGEVPPTIEAVMLARLDRRSPLERQVLQAAATFGLVFWPAGVERLLGGSGVEGVLEGLARAGFVVREAQPVELPGPAWRFAHALLQAVVAQGVGQRTRRAWHGRAALWVSEEVTGEHAARVARHQSEAGDPARATLSWLRAAELATASLAPAEAAAALAHALTEDDRAGQVLGFERRAATEQALAARRRAEGDLAQADALLAAAAARDPEPLRRAERLRLQAEVGEALGELSRARTLLAEALAIIGDLPEGLLIRQTIERDEAWLAWRDGRSDEAVGRLTALLSELTPGHPLRGPVQNALGVVAWGRGEHAEAQQRYRLALAAFEAHNDLPATSSAYNNLAILAMRQGDYASAETFFKRGLRIKAERGDREGLARAYNNLGTLYGEMADYPRAARYLTEAIRIRERVGHGSLAVSYANLGEVLLKQGHADAAAEHLERALGLCREGRGPAYLLPDVLRMLAELCLAQGDLSTATDRAREAIEIAQKSGDRSREGVATRVLGEALLARGDADAGAALDQAIELLAEEPTQRARAEALRAVVPGVPPA